MKKNVIKVGKSLTINNENGTRPIKKRTTSAFIKNTEPLSPRSSVCSPPKQSNFNILNQYSSSDCNKKPSFIEKRPSLMLKIARPTLCLQKTHRRTIFKKTENFENIQTTSSLIQKMIKVLENKFILNQKQANLLLIKRQDMKKLLGNCLLYRTSFYKDELLQNHQEFDKCLSGVWEIIDYQINQEKRSRMKVFNNNILQKYTNKDFNNQVSMEKSKLVQLESEKKAKELAISELDHQAIEIQTRKQFMAKLVNEKERYFHSLEHKSKELVQSNIAIEGAIAEKQAVLDKLKSSYDQILNFVNTQDKNKIIKLISEDYKHIEGDIYEYATYLQSNQLASSLTYQHLPVVCHTYTLDDQLAALNKVLVQNDELPLKEKSRMLRDFLLEVIEKYRKKDIEIEKLLAFKTKCVITFVEKMKKWLNNWELKQEYLNNLRMEHAYNHEKILQKFKKFNSQSLCSECQGLINWQKSTIVDIYTKLQQNYKMGNSFY